MKVLLRMTQVAIAVVAILATLAVPVWADWDPVDGHKMHFPQLPDPNGWDVDVTTGFVADDWQCSGTGPVDDIHFWISAEGDNWGNGIDFIEVRIYDDVAQGDDPDQAVTWSHPGAELWFSQVEDQAASGDVFTVRQPHLTGSQGWYTPMGSQPYYNYPDHVNYWQVNIQDIVAPFDQTFDEIYWLEIHIIPNALTAEQVGSEMQPPLFGWKTSQNHWNDDAVYEDNEYNWQELWDPRPEINPPESLDMAFVITPEPASIVLLMLGAVGIVSLRGRK